MGMWRCRFWVDEDTLLTSHWINVTISTRRWAGPFGDQASFYRNLVNFCRRRLATSP